MEKEPKQKEYNSLKEIFDNYNIELYDEMGVLRNAIDILEDMYLKLHPNEFGYIVNSISKTESKVGHIFDKARGRKYRK